MHHHHNHKALTLFLIEVNYVYSTEPPPISHKSVTFDLSSGMLFTHNE